MIGFYICSDCRTPRLRLASSKRGKRGIICQILITGPIAYQFYMSLTGRAVQMMSQTPHKLQLLAIQLCFSLSLPEQAAPTFQYDLLIGTQLGVSSPIKARIRVLFFQWHNYQQARLDMMLIASGAGILVW